MNEIKEVIHSLLRMARERVMNDTVEEILRAVDIEAAKQHSEHGIYHPGKCPHQGLAELWGLLAPDGVCESYLNGDDVRKILALVPSWAPEWYQTLAEKKQSVCCPTCGGKGWVKRSASAVVVLLALLAGCATTPQPTAALLARIDQLEQRVEALEARPTLTLKDSPRQDDFLPVLPQVPTPEIDWQFGSHNLLLQAGCPDGTRFQCGEGYCGCVWDTPDAIFIEGGL